MIGFLRNVIDIGLTTYTAWRDDRTLRLGAGLAYYALFAVIPLLAITAALAEIVFGLADVEQYLGERLEQVGVDETEAVSAAIAAELEGIGTQSSLGLIGLISLFFAASLAFVAFTDAVNVIWDVPVRSGWGNLIRRRLVAFLMVLVAGGVLIAGVAVGAVAGAAEALLPFELSSPAGLDEALSSAATSIALALALALLFRYVAPVRVPWKGAILAGFVTALLMAISTALVAWYLRNLGGDSVAGAFGALLAGLTWVYVEAQLILAGIQLMKVLAATHPELFDGEPEEVKAAAHLDDPGMGDEESLESARQESR